MFFWMEDLSISIDCNGNTSYKSIYQVKEKTSKRPYKGYPYTRTPASGEHQKEQHSVQK